MEQSSTGKKPIVSYIPILSVSNPIQTRALQGAYYAPHTTTSLPGFKKLSTHMDKFLIQVDLN